LEIIGHTDNIGSEFYNLELSKKRAKSVANFLIAEGIDSKRIKYQGKGMTYPKADNSTQEGRDKNRRVEFIIYR
jgi:outer membrane protein OmpA-like peptidoglycan-associated protein